MAIDWNKVIISTDDESVYAICGKTALFVTGNNSGGGGGGGGDAVYATSVIRTSESEEYSHYEITYTDGTKKDTIVSRDGMYDGVYEYETPDTMEENPVSIWTNKYDVDYDGYPSIFRVDFAPVQSGSGTPSQQNPRPFVPLTGLKFIHQKDYNLITKWENKLSDNSQLKIPSSSNSNFSIYRGTGELVQNDFEHFVESELSLPAGTYKFGKNYVHRLDDPYTVNLYIYDKDTSQVIVSLEGQTNPTVVEFTLATAKPNLIIYANLIDLPDSYSANENITFVHPRIYRPVYSDENDIRSNGGIYEIDFPANVYMGNVDFVNKKFIAYGEYIESYNGENVSGMRWLSSLDEYSSGSTPTIGAEVLVYTGSVGREIDIDIPFDSNDLFSHDLSLSDYLINGGAEPQMHNYTIKSNDGENITSVIYNLCMYFTPAKYAEYLFYSFEAPSDGKYYVRQNKSWVDLLRIQDNTTGYYVDGTNGSDDNDGKTSATAFATLEKAISLLPKNHRTTYINIAAGTYQETTEYNSSGWFRFVEANVVIVPYGGEVILNSWVYFLDHSNVTLYSGIAFNQPVYVENGTKVQVITNNAGPYITFANDNDAQPTLQIHSSDWASGRIRVDGDVKRIRITGSSHVTLGDIYTDAWIDAESGAIVSYSVPNNSSSVIRQSADSMSRIFTGNPYTIYVDGANGDDDNPGTSTEPIKKLYRAINYVPEGNELQAIINVSGTHEPFSSYQFEIHNKKIKFCLTGDVVLDGGLEISGGSEIEVTGYPNSGTHTLSLLRDMTITERSYMSITQNLSINDNMGGALSVYDGSRFENYGYNTTITIVETRTDSAYYGVIVNSGSMVYLGDINITAKGGISSGSGAVVAYKTLTGTMTTETTCSTGGRIYTGSDSGGGGGGGTTTAVWGEIIGVLSNQTDLQGALNSKVGLSDLGDMAEEDDAPSDGLDYVRHNGEWVAAYENDVQTFYVNASTGSDNNDGSSATPFATISKAIEKAYVVSAVRTIINVAAGTYNESINLSGFVNIAIFIGGAVTINGLDIQDRSYLTIFGSYSNTSLTTTYGVAVGGQSYLSIDCPYTHSYSGDNILVGAGSVFFVNQISVTGNTEYGIRAVGASQVYVGVANITAGTALCADYGAVITYRSLTGTYVNATETANGGRIYVGSQPALGTMATVDDAPSNGNEYVRKNGAWSVSSGGGGGGSTAWGSITGTLSSQTDLSTALNAKADSADLGTMAEIDDAPSDGSEYVRKNGNWAIVSSGGDIPEAITVYVNGTTGSDTNDGSSEHPFATIAKAISEVPAGITDASVINITAGTYTERLSIESKTIHFFLGGNVTVDNTISVTANSYLRITGSSSATLTINSGLTVYSNSCLLHEIPMTIISQYSALSVVESKFVNSYNKTLTVTSTGQSTYGVSATTSSLVFLGTVNITAETGIRSTAGAIVAYDTLTGTMTTQTSQDVGGRIYTGTGGSTSATAWGDITGTLSNQTDLSTALAAKANSADLGSIAGANYTISHTDLTSGTSPLPTGDLYFYW